MLAAAIARQEGRAPTITSFRASPSSITLGDFSELSWQVEGRENITLRIEPDVGSITGDRITVQPEETTTYTLTAMNAAGESSARATVRVGKVGVSVHILPEQVTLAQGQSQEFMALVTGAEDKGVEWHVSGGTLSGSGPTVLYTAPEQAGSYTVRATSQADASQSATATVTIEEVGVSITPARVELLPGESQEFTAQVVGADDTSVTWSASGGSITGTGSVVLYHAPDAPGEYRVVAGSRSAPSAKAMALAVVAAANQAPKASFTAEPNEGNAPLEVLFDAGQSSDVDGEIVSYTWDFGDGMTGDRVTASHTFHAGGSFEVTLTVTDDDGAQDTASRTIAVGGTAENQQPDASFTVDPRSGSPPLTVQVDASGSSDPDGEIASYTWDFGDGATGKGVTLQHEYTEEGTYTIVLTVGDDGGATATAEQNVTVGKGGFEQTAEIEQVSPPRNIYQREWLAVDGSYALVREVGAVGVYQRQADKSWQRVNALTPDDDTYKEYGIAVALSDDDAAVLSERLVAGSTEETEAVVQLFERDSQGQWQERSVLLAGDGIPATLRGVSIDLKSGTLAVGRPKAGNSGANVEESAVFLFEENAGGEDAWGMVKTIRPVVPEEGPWFGTDVSLSEDGNSLIVADAVQNNDSGRSDTSVHVYQRNEGGLDAWGQVKMLGVQVCLKYNSAYVDIDGDTFVVTNMPTIFGPASKLLIYQHDAVSGDWLQRGNYVISTTPDEDPDEGTGASSQATVVMRADILVASISALRCYHEEADCGQDSVFVFARNQGGENAWGRLQVIQREDGDPLRHFGVAMDIASDGRTIIIGTHQGDGSGAAFIYQR